MERLRPVQVGKLLGVTPGRRGGVEQTEARGAPGVFRLLEASG